MAGVDLAVVGWFSTTAHVSAVATGSQMMQAVTVVITGLTMGVTVLLGHALGAGDPKTGRGRNGRPGPAVFPLGPPVRPGDDLLLAPWLTRLMQVPAAAVDATVAYIRICAGGTVFITAYNVISGLFRGIGNSRSPFLFVLIACLVNVVLDLLFVGVPSRMGAAGASRLGHRAGPGGQRGLFLGLSAAGIPFPFPWARRTCAPPASPKASCGWAGPSPCRSCWSTFPF